MSQGRRFGPYQGVRELARGGMGAVYEAVHPATGARVAVKTLLPDGLGLGGAIERARFRREAEALASVDHPHLVRVHAADLDGPAPWVAQDLLPGGSLQERLVRQGPLAPDEAVALVRKVAEGVAHAHARGLLHRDIKPHNVMFDDRGEPRLVDFGLVLGLEDAHRRLTVTGEVLGTPSYMAPEQALGVRADTPATDVYGLGALLYSALTAVPPFDGRSTFAVLEAVATVEPAPPRAHRPTIPAAIEAVCLRAMAKRREDRFASADELVEALRAPAAVRARRRARSFTPLLVATVGAAALGAVALAAAAWWRAPQPPSETPRPVTQPPRPVRPAPPPRGKPHAWFATLAAPDERPPALPEGVETREQPREYRNVRDGSILVWIPPGQATIGSVATDPWAYPDEAPQLVVPVESGFFLGKLEVTWEQWSDFRKANPEHPSLPRLYAVAHDHPVHGVSLDDALAYCAWAGLRLPREVEWEYAARCGTPRRYPWGDDDPIGGVNLKGLTASGRTSPGGSMPHDVTLWGCFDMAGNVQEWCGDDAGEYAPGGPRPRPGHAIRGGSWGTWNAPGRCAKRRHVPPGSSMERRRDPSELQVNPRNPSDIPMQLYLGFRVARSP